MVTFPPFDSYVCDGEHVEIQHEGFTIRATVHDDPDMGAPWKEHDGHGPVSEWTSRPKRPGERILARDGDSYRYYDFAEAVAIAKRDGWGPPIEGASAAAQAATAVEQDYAALKGWCDDEWDWCGVAVTVWKAGICLTGKYANATWGIERNYPGSDNSYLAEAAAELVDEALEDARLTLAGLAA